MQLFTLKTFPAGHPAKGPAPLPVALQRSPREFLKMTSPEPGYSESFQQPAESGMPNAGTPPFHH